MLDRFKLKRACIIFTFLAVLFTSSHVFADNGGKSTRLEFQIFPNANGSISVEGLAIGNSGEEVSITVSSGDSIEINGVKTYQNNVLSETTAIVNTNVIIMRIIRTFP